MFTSCFISSDSKFGSVKHTSIYENSEANIFENIKLLGELSDDLLGTNLCKTIKSCW